MKDYGEKIRTLTERAKDGNRYTGDLTIGESAYLLALLSVIYLYRSGEMPKEETQSKQKELESQLLKYYQLRECYDMHIGIQNRCSEVLTEAEKTGCPVCRKIVRIFDGRESL